MTTPGCCAAARREAWRGERRAARGVRAVHGAVRSARRVLCRGAGARLMLVLEDERRQAFVYWIDARHIGKTPFGLETTRMFLTNFLAEAVAELRECTRVPEGVIRVPLPGPEYLPCPPCALEVGAGPGLKELGLRKPRSSDCGSRTRARTGCKCLLAVRANFCEGCRLIPAKWRPRLWVTCFWKHVQQF